MSFLEQLRSLVDEPPPSHVFELSPRGIAFAIRSGKRNQPPRVYFHPFDVPVLAISPVKDNVLMPEVLHDRVASLVPQTGGGRRKRDAALILPDYCARVAVLDFESFPSDRTEQQSLVRFRMKKTVPFDLDSASLSFHARSVGKRYEVVVAAAPVEVIARYEAPFRASGYLPGFATTSTLAAVDLLPTAGLQVLVKLCDQDLTVAILEGRNPKLVRCVELDHLTVDDVMSVVFPTLAYAEDAIPQKPERIYGCGLGPLFDSLRSVCQAELGLEMEPIRSPWGTPNEVNAGLLGWLQAQEGKA
jgi:type IV pilus assembly protein PilM